ncbi:hypothetical protein [Streptomyces hainanensis]|uniref:Uncharacterized protein n=1 Tax=Streptomyces hainanensis TaxID=402648 RepID=A0A4R4SKJ5_9ACTN|nr:hypothetical protein [Streptomyces hainanensis]TDC62552.1 hypothetical protein E1283_33905 [Streptomyces hainanensis]
MAVVAAPLLPQPAVAASPPPAVEDREEDRPAAADQPILWWEPAPTTPGPVRDLGEPAPAAARRGGEVPPVLPLGAGLACLGLGLGLLGYRLRQ